jgi:hypothetical protein
MVQGVVVQMMILDHWGRRLSIGEIKGDVHRFGGDVLIFDLGFGEGGFATEGDQ